MSLNYIEIMRELNQEYEKVSARAQQNQHNSRLGYSENYADNIQAQAQNMWEEVIDVALDITGSYSDNSFKVSQVGDYQFWSDKDELAIVDIRTGNLVAYTQTGGLVPQKVPDYKLPSARDKNNLIGKIIQNNPIIILETNNMILEKAHSFFKPLDPVSRVKEVEKKKLNLDRLLEIVDKTIDSSILALSNFKQKCRNTANNITANKLMRQTAVKFEEAWRKTEEDSYDLGDYKVSKIDDVYRVVDLEDNLVVAYNNQNGELKLLESTGDRQKLEEALAQISPSPAIGDVNRRSQYNYRVAQAIKNLSVFPDGKHDLEGNTLVKQGISLTLRDANGRKLLVRDEDNKSNSVTNISQKQIEQVERASASFQNELEQAERVEVAARAVAEFLRGSRTTKIDKSEVFCQYNPQTKVLTYQEKSEPGNYFQAKKTLGGKWENIRGKSNISEERVAELQKAVESLENRQLRRKQRKQQQKQKRLVR